MLSKLKYLLASLCFVITFTSCQKEESVLKSEEVDPYYQINNKQAATNLYSVMYNTEDTTNKIERFKLVHISDAHLSSWSSDNDYRLPKNLKEAVRFSNQKELKINAMVATGDHIGTMIETTRTEAVLFLQSFNEFLYRNNRIPTYVCWGNHDSNMLNRNPKQNLNEADMNKILRLGSNIEKGKGYYYVDLINPMGGYIRIISLDMIDQIDSMLYDSQHNAYFSQKQVDWLCNIALSENLTPDHSIVILTHYPFQKYDKAGYTYLNNGDFVHPWNMIPEIVEAFRKKEPIEKEYENKFRIEDRILVRADFSSTPGEFVCYLGGHAHVTAMFRITSGLSNQSKELSPQLMLLCTNMSPSEKGVQYNKVPRVSKSLSCNSFCIYAIDTKEKSITTTCFGAKQADKDGKLVDISVNYYFEPHRPIQ